MNNETNEFLLLFRGEHWDQGRSDVELGQIMNRVHAWFGDLQQSGKVKAGQPLAHRGVTVSGSKRTIADGPFAESKEAVAGYLLVYADDFDAAVAIAQTCPTLDHGITIEVRPVLDECPIFARVKERLALANA